MVKIDKETAFGILENVKDPEIPLLSIIDMGILRDFYYENETAIAVITPTYSGCPAMTLISDMVKEALQKSGLDKVEVISQISPAWTTEWMTEKAKANLKACGIAPPLKLQMTDLFNMKFDNHQIECPFCNSSNTKKTNEFGSTACKSLHYCNDCSQPFDYFKCI